MHFNSEPLLPLSSENRRPHAVARIPARWLLATTIAALFAFLLPQEAPLAWLYPELPSSDQLYLHLTAKSDGNAALVIFYGTSLTQSELESIRLPLSASPRPISYTLPLPNAVIADVTLAAPPPRSKIDLSNFSIVSRSGALVAVLGQPVIVGVDADSVARPAPGVIRLRAVPPSKFLLLVYRLEHPVAPRDMNRTNILRCLASIFYLAALLSLLSVAVLVSFSDPPSWRRLQPRIVVVLVASVLFSFVGNRRLVLETLRNAYASAHMQVR